MTKILTFISMLFFVLLYSPMAFTGDLYKWLDESGHIHFTDNPSKIPHNLDEYEKRELKDNPVMKEAASETLDLAAQGKMVWDNSCRECHYIGRPPRGDSPLRALPDNIISSDQSIESISSQLKYSLELRSGDMNDIKLDDDEINALGQYILKRTQPKK